MPYCEAHKYMMKLVESLDKEKEHLRNESRKLAEANVRLTENIIEIRDTLRELKIYNEEQVKELKIYNEKQDKSIIANSNFVMKAVGVIGTLSFVAATSPIVFWLIDRLSGA